MSEERFILPKHNREFALARLMRFAELAWPGKAVEILVRLKKTARSSQQNRYLHGVAYKRIADATGYEIEDVAEFLCGTYFGWVTVKAPITPSNPRGVKDVPRRTTTKDEDGKRDVLKWDAFGDYTGWIQRFGARKGIDIPDPDPEWFKKNAKDDAEDLDYQPEEAAA